MSTPSQFQILMPHSPLKRLISIFMYSPIIMTFLLMIMRTPQRKLSLNLPELKLDGGCGSSQLDVAKTILMFISWAQKTVMNSWSPMGGSEHRQKYTKNYAITCTFRAEETELNCWRQLAICSAVFKDCVWEGDGDNCLTAPFPSACLNIECVATGCQHLNWQSGEWLLILEFRLQYK